ncbi:hypothetical protein F3Y22_tig00112347pilonHSYRG00008 [Hibiscus syriacus]|uniref:Uncharacterized protein n=1 Tax=Hibiscus syriacus TaxID=106335 RepID=A0A6A2X0Z4_HIBSY|nr:hypothetical protein F3Y22_tig00112347pilonHSYRG00008 [Hibiscus syriacus]
MERKSSSCRRRRNSIGCVPAIFSFFSKHNKRSKFISCGKEKREEAAHDEERLKDAKLVIRSPTLPINFLDSGADKRVKLPQVGAVEKCDEDLKALQRINEVVKTSISVGLGDSNELRRRRSLQQKHQLIKKKAEEEKIAPTATATTGAGGFLHRFTTEHVAYTKSNNNDEENDSVSGVRRRNALTKAKCMIQSVHEVCKDIAWGERREIGIIGLALQHHICRDLIHELVKEIACYSN